MILNTFFSGSFWDFVMELFVEMTRSEEWILLKTKKESTWQEDICVERFSCSECVDEMHKLGWMVKMGAVPIHVKIILFSYTWNILKQLQQLTFVTCPYMTTYYFLKYYRQDYVSANYCPTLGEDQAWCEEALSRYYVGMLVSFWKLVWICWFFLFPQFAVVEHYFVDGAVHVCQTGGACDAAKEWVRFLLNS